MDAKEFLLHHGEKIALGAVGLIVLVGVLMLFAGGETEAETIGRLVEQVDMMIANPPNRDLPDLKHAENIQDRWNNVPNPQPLKSWVFGKRYLIVRELEPMPKDDLGDDPIHRAPSLRVVERSTGYLVLGYGTDVEVAEVVKALLFRTLKLGRDGEPVFPEEPTYEMAADGKEFRDEEGILPRKKFFYKMQSRARSTNPKVPLDEVDVALWSKVIAVDVPSNVYLFPVGIEKGSVLKNIKAKARIEVYKWFPVESRWRFDLFKVEVGQEVGEVVKLTGGDEVDYRTGFILIEARMEKKKERVPGIKGEVTREYRLIRYRDKTDADADPEEVLGTRELRQKLTKLKKSKKLIPEEDAAASHKCETCGMTSSGAKGCCGAPMVPQ